MQDYSVSEAAQILGISERQLRRFIREGFLDIQGAQALPVEASGPPTITPTDNDAGVSEGRGAAQDGGSANHTGKDPSLWMLGEGGRRLDFQDLVLLRTAKNLLALRVSTGRIRRALEVLRARLPANQPLSGVRVTLQGDELVVRDSEGVWAPESGQTFFDFSTAHVSVASIAPLEGAFYNNEVFADFYADNSDGDDDRSLLSCEDFLDARESAAEMRCADWMDLAEAFEEERKLLPARSALRRALECDPFEIEARRRLGKLLEREGLWERAEVHYRLARQHRPDDAELVVDHGRMLAQLELVSKALDAFEVARALEPRCQDAYLGAAEMYERLGDTASAERILRELRRVTDPAGDQPPQLPTRS
ncbi:MAG: tetratricopeptide repeat protein [Myxococcales bacterium]|nr:tetratricopeptide repeat protein [Myxococcales bacterium]